MSVHPIHPRSGVYYWKCDRPAAFHGAQAVAAERSRPELAALLGAAIERALCRGPATLRPAGGQGNHLTFELSLGGGDYFVRVEDGPERDDYLEVESHVLGAVAALGVPAPRVIAVDASRRDVPFAWQVLEHLRHFDLNRHYKEGRLEPVRIARALGAATARWQALTPPGFGPFDPKVLRDEGTLRGFHRTYADYFFLQLERHLEFLGARGFLAPGEVAAIRAEITRHTPLLALPAGCLVHKDLALWNVLGTPGRIVGVIDWDDAIAGDPTDDLSLLGCFHDGATVAEAIAGYSEVRPLPPDFRRRFWLHLLRNMIVKAVIRVGAGYFERTDAFYLIGAGGTGASLRDFTLARLDIARRGLRDDAEPADLL